MDRAAAGDHAALARLISLVESDGANASNVERAVADRVACGESRISPIIGLTGPPGAGKSTLTNALVAAYRASGLSVAVLAVDPSSTMTGGSILGDRVRMHTADEHTFVRSVPSRGKLGGLAASITPTIQVLEVTGWDVILIESVGVGQSEIDIAGQADTTVVLCSPAGGDAVQGMKAGLLEHAEILVVNKADIPGADAAVASLRQTQHLRAAAAWETPILRTIATTGEGVDELVEAIGDHQRHLDESGELLRLREERRMRTVEASVQEAVRHLLSDLRATPSGHAVVEAAAAGTCSPTDAANKMLALLQLTTDR